MKVAVLGCGVEGTSAARYFESLGNEVTVFEKYSGDNLDDFDLVVRSPSNVPSKIKARKVSSGTIEFLDRCPAPIIGVTGTKGKGTTCSFIASILRAADYTVHLVGNIGTPALDELPNIKPNDIVVYEMSSFQLWDLQKSPSTAVVLQIEPDHLDIHEDFSDYIAAKENIASHQQAGDLVVYYAKNEISVKIAQMSLGKRLAYPSEKGARISGNDLLFSEQKICSIDAIKLPGVHNLENALAAISAVWHLPKVTPQVIEKGLSSFSGLPHRLKFVREVGGVSYYDDSISTTEGSTIAAIKAFIQPKILILGGSSKGVEFSELIPEIEQAEIRQMILLGEEAAKLEDLLVAAGLKNFVNLGQDTTMTDVVRWAADSAEPGDVVMLSPACASLDMFKSYIDRGDQFIAAVEKL
ncbi:MAG: UDP-N-acetylmuramoyl-L-alanine--D-glutamate ligase [Candidatus Nomurabacteria bacterium]|jgi:UDP-N-acetylmuramoylalanine--D-glutamate ligase|nr:UDP-N-acetylmuramoyl-L-alanine--D-glutamate ligase [Candidatus Nomurabacteria bacterium]